MARILISGASGFIGRPLISYFESQGHVVVPLARSFDRSFVDFEGYDVVVHLAGEPLTLSRWDEEKREKILTSRVDGTKSLCHFLSQVSHPPKVFLSASAFGYYGDRGDEQLTESSQLGSGFLSDVCRQWELATIEIEKRGVRTVHMRFGIVLGPNGGALQKMLLPYKLGLGGKIGSGNQWISWIALNDLIRAIDHVVKVDALKGPINFVSPYPVRQKEFAQTLAEALHRPCIFTTPEWVLRLRFGQSAKELLLSSARVDPTKLLASNFLFHYPHLRAALQIALE